MIYHYPKTGRPDSRDSGEVEALKWALRYGMPVFTITNSANSAQRRAVRLSWVEDFDDAAEIFLVVFGEDPPDRIESEDERPFFLTATEEERRALRKVRRGQHEFKFAVLKRYGGECAVCPISVLELLDAAQICAKGESGSNDARNGLLLCALHHRAFDGFLWTVRPDTLEIETRDGGPDASGLRITRGSLQHLPRSPHHAALAHAWAKWQRDTGTQ